MSYGENRGFPGSSKDLNPEPRFYVFHSVVSPVPHDSCLH